MKPPNETRSGVGFQAILMLYLNTGIMKKTRSEPTSIKPAQCVPTCVNSRRSDGVNRRKRAASYTRPLLFCDRSPPPTHNESRERLESRRTLCYSIVCCAQKTFALVNKTSLGSSFVKTNH